LRAVLVDGGELSADLEDDSGAAQEEAGPVVFGDHGGDVAWVCCGWQVSGRRGEAGEAMVSSNVRKVTQRGKGSDAAPTRGPRGGRRVAEGRIRAAAQHGPTKGREEMSRLDGVLPYRKGHKKGGESRTEYF
jgi:hypothetical protein